MVVYEPGNGARYDLDLARELMAADLDRTVEDRLAHADEWEACGLDPLGTLERFAASPAHKAVTYYGERCQSSAEAIAHRVLGTINVHPSLASGFKAAKA